MLSKLKLGGHVPAGQGLGLVAVSARSLDYSAVQIMVGSLTERPWIPYQIDDAAARQYKKVMYGIETYIHLPFTINPCEGASRKRAFGKVTLNKFVAVSRALGARAMVIHPGFRGGDGTEEQVSEVQAMRNLVSFFNEIEDLSEEAILLETDAGSKNGSRTGSLEFIGEALEGIVHENFGMCLDTAHLYARGVDCWDERVRQGIVGTFEKRVKLVHLNVPDADVGLGSFRDRHNTPFEESTANSEGMIRDFVGRWPCILERSSMAVQAMDVKYIRKLMAEV